MNHQFHMEQSPEHGGPASQVAQAGSSSPGATASAPVSPYATNPANATYTANGVGYQHANNLHHYNQQQQQQQQQMHLQQDHRLHHHHQQQQPQQHYLTAHHALLQQPGQHQHAIMQQPQATSDDLYPRQPQQQHSPQMATSPAIMPAGQHQQFHQAGPPAPMSPYTGYTNGYHHQHHHPTHHPLHDLGHQQQHQPVSAQQQHQPHPHHQHHHTHHAHQQPHQQHHYANHQGHHQSQYQQQHHHHAAFMQLDDAYTAQHGSPAYGQFPQRNADSRTNPTSGLSPVGSVVHQAAGPQPANNIVVQQQFRHYGSTSNNIIKVPTPNTTTTISETMLLNSRSGNVQLATNSSPQLQHHQQNLIKSPTSANSDSQSAGCRRQSSSVMSTGSAGSNLSDHQSSLDSPSSALAPNHQLGVPIPMAQVEHGGADQSPSIGLDGPLVAGKPEIKREPKESRLSQLHQQCAVLLDKQQQDQQHMVSINSPNSNPEANVNNATHSGGGGGGGGGANNNNNNTLNNGNSNTGRSKRLRTSFKHHQLKEMKRKFQINQNPDAKELRDLSDKTGLSKRVLQVWFQNARAKFRRNNAKAANQQLYDGLGQHNPHMLQFQQQGLQQQSYHHHSHHHHAISIVEQTSMTTVQQQQLQPQQQQQQPQVPQQHQQSSQHHHGLTTAPSQDSPAIT